MDNKEILWISCYAPYDKVDHAGGKIHNYFLKYLHKTCGNVRLLTICREEEREKIDLDQYGIPNDLIVLKKRIACKAVRFMGALNAEYNIFHRYAGRLTGYRERPMKARLKRICHSGYRPGVIILDWTEIIVLMPYICRLFPDSKIVMIEEDVSYLLYERRWKAASGPIRTYIYGKRYDKLKKLELAALRKAHKVILNNRKDRDLLVSDGLSPEKMLVWCPYFDNMVHVSRKPEYHSMIYYGAMNRKENYQSAIWFIENVMPLIEDLDVTLEIIGGHPNPVLEKYESARVHILGYVQDVSPYFQKGLCMVAPLVSGAGVKIKVLEALSSGIPVLTNAIGIEGIYAEAGEEYLHCEVPEEYANMIRRLADRELDSELISRNSKSFIDREYNSEKSAEEFVEMLLEGLGGNRVNGQKEISENSCHHGYI